MKSNALSYLLRTRIRNQLVSFLKKPVRLIYVAVFIGLLALTLVGGKAGESDADRVIRDFSELTAGLNYLLIIMFAVNFLSGLKNGGSFFKMSDVNFLFPSPINKRSVLFYALIQQIWTTLLIGVFILFQYTSLHLNYNLGFGGLLLICLAYSVSVFFSQTAAMFTYTLISDSDRNRRLVKTGFIFLVLLLAAYVGVNALRGRNGPIEALASAGNSFPVLLFPFAGWMGAAAGGVLTGNYLQATIFLLLTGAVFTALLAAMARSKREYYEDVLASAESVQNMMNAVRDGIAPEAAPRNIRVGRTGLGKGEGASAFFYKHLVENRRASKLPVRPASLIFTLITIGFSFFVRDGGLLPVFVFSAYIQIFSVAMGRFNRELTKPYIYLIPEPPFKKLLFALAESLPTELLESALVYIPVAFILGLPAYACILAILGRLSFSILYLAAIVMIERIWGGTLSKVAGMLVYLFCDILLALPGIILAIVSRLMWPAAIPADAAALLCLTAANIPVAALLLYLSRNLLRYAET
ncbi:MAG: putative ABC exporter domain-containing protein [Oscillospiraceae bacterium]|jgi:hypothetical protein|nr:putative ABC exporter domain-containing protein [Oscillospiraceae bacterium]